MSSSISPQTRPNVLFIMTDQHRADLLSCAGNDLVPTPHIDRIAARGVRFDNAYCSYPVCLASRSALLSGLHAHDTGAIDNVDRLDWRYRTIAHHFAEQNYLTGLVGKMHFNDAHNHGFDYYLSINDWLMYLGPQVQHYANEIANHPLGSHFFKSVHDDGAGFPDVDLWEKPGPWAGHVEAFPLDDPGFRHMASALEAEHHMDMFIARESVEFMRRYREQSFMLVASFMKPHTPFYAPAEYAERYPIDAMELSAAGDISLYPEHIRRRIKNTGKQPLRRRQAHKAGYLGNLAFADSCVGHLYDGLEELGLVDNTIVVYTADHGEMLGDHGLFQKFCLFEGATKVPLIVSWPGHIPEGEVSAALVEYIGLYPTLSDLAGLPTPVSTTIAEWPAAPAELAVESFAPLCYRPQDAGPEAVFAEYDLRRNPQYMVRTERYKYIHNQRDCDELYDLLEDPGELRNIAVRDDVQRVVDEHRERLFSWFDPAANSYYPA